jgi:FkbM family methyltransferase
MPSLKSLVGTLPQGLQLELKRLKYRVQIGLDSFVPDEPEIREIRRLVRPGDVVVDIGANIGYYTCQLAAQVGVSGRVVALEPIADTFELLTSNIRAAGFRNVTLMNIAASSVAGLSAMDIPSYDGSGLKNFYQARIADKGTYQVLCLPLDSLSLPSPVRLVKIDAEGHDLEVLRGMERILRESRPILIIESTDTGSIPEWLKARGYTIRRAGDSPNIVAEADR